MSTRGCVAVGTIRFWTGLYNHSDSYPGGLGKDVWTLARAHHQGGAYVTPEAGLRVFGEALLRFTRWENFTTNGSGHDAHSHISSTAPDPLHIEWVYIIDAEAEALHVLAAMEDEKTRGDVSPWYTPGKRAADVPRKLPKGLWDYGHCRYRHKRVISIPFAVDATPNWYMIGCYQTAPKNFDRSQLYHPVPNRGPTAFERILRDELED
jgi:hypothetical protein